MKQLAILVLAVGLIGCGGLPTDSGQLITHVQPATLMPACPGARANVVAATNHILSNEYRQSIRINAIAACRDEWVKRLRAAPERFQCTGGDAALACTHQDSDKGTKDGGVEIVFEGDAARITLWDFGA